MGDALLPFVLTALAVELTPGPNMAWLALLSAQSGRLVGLAAVAGVATGLLLLGVVGRRFRHAGHQPALALRDGELGGRGLPALSGLG